MRTTVTLQQALDDPQLLGHVMQGESWANARCVVKVLNREPITNEEFEIYRGLTGRYRLPSSITEAELIFGRRSGKDVMCATLGVYLAAICDHQDVLAPGETGTLLIIAPDLKQSRVTLKYCLGILENSPKLSERIVGSTADTIELNNGIVIEARAASFRRVRGVTAIAILANEAAFWHSDDTSANADTEILNACRPMLATTGGPLIIFTSPYGKKGEVYEIYKKHYGPDGADDILVFQAPTREMNPTIPQSVIDRAIERDPEMASAEYGAQFRSDISSFIDRDVIESLVERGVAERPYDPRTRYYGAVDPSGGAVDSFTLSISHKDENGNAVLDVVREAVAPLSPEQTVAEFAKTMKNYRLSRVTGDAYAGLWPREQFAKYGIQYQVSERNRSAIYQEFLPLANSRRVRLLDNRRLVNQLASLERRTGRTGRDIIDHGIGAHDDVCNAAALALLLAAEPQRDTRLQISHYEIMA